MSYWCLPTGWRPVHAREILAGKGDPVVRGEGRARGRSPASWHEGRGDDRDPRTHRVELIPETGNRQFYLIVPQRISFARDFLTRRIGIREIQFHR